MQWQLAVVLICIVWAASQLVIGARRWLRRGQGRDGCGSCASGCEPAQTGPPLVSLQDAAEERRGTAGNSD